MPLSQERPTERMVRRMSGVRKQVHRNAGVSVTTEQRRVAKLSGHLGFSSAGFTEPAKTIPVHATCDVLVVGSGPSGLSAAIGAARAGADVMLVERFGCFGGVITTVGMETLGWYRYEGTVDSEGIGTEMERIAERMGGTTKWPYNDSPCLDADQFKIVADGLVKEHAIRPMLHTWVVEAIVEAGAIVGVVTESKSGRRAIRAQRVVDCTGDADIAHLAGARYTCSDRTERMGMTSVFAAAGVNTEKFVQYATVDNPSTYADWIGVWDQKTTGKEDDLQSPMIQTEFHAAAKRGVGVGSEGNALGMGAAMAPSADGASAKAGQRASVGGSWSALTPAGEATNLNLVHLNGFDALDVDDLTRAEMAGRANVADAVEALRMEVPGFEDAKLRNLSMTMGTRDSRKIVGRYDLTGEDVLGEYRCEDSIGVFPEFVDGYNILVLPTTGRYFQVPLGCCITPDVDNLLVAGRCVAGDRVSHAATRNMMCCTVTGQGAGVAAAVSVSQKVSTSAVDIADVQRELRRQGVKLD